MTDTPTPAVAVTLVQLCHVLPVVAVVDADLLLLGDKWTSDHYDWRLEVQLVEPAPQRAADPGPTPQDVF